MGGQGWPCTCLSHVRLEGAFSRRPLDPCMMKVGYGQRTTGRSACVCYLSEVVIPELTSGDHTAWDQPLLIIFPMQLGNLSSISLVIMSFDKFDVLRCVFFYLKDLTICFKE